MNNEGTDRNDPNVYSIQTSPLSTGNLLPHPRRPLIAQVDRGWKRLKWTLFKKLNLYERELKTDIIRKCFGYKKSNKNMYSKTHFPLKKSHPNAYAKEKNIMSLS